METQFETKIDAEKALDAERIKSLGWCPVIKEPCKKNCTCYYEGDIHHQPPKRYPGSDPTKEYWFVQFPGCTNVLISGVITVES